MLLDYFKEIDGYDSMSTEVFEGIHEVEYISDDNNFNIIHFNIRSIRKNFEELMIYLNQVKLNNIGAIVLSETF